MMPPVPHSLTTAVRRLGWAALAALAIVAGCLDTTDPNRPGSLAIRFEKPKAAHPLTNLQSGTAVAATHMDSARAVVSGNTDVTVTLIQSGSTLTHTIDGLVPGPYAIALTGYAQGAVVYRANTSATVSAGTTATAIAPAPSSTTFIVGALKATATSSTQIDLTWVDSASNEDGFKIERCTGPLCTPSAPEIKTAAANVASASDVGLTANTTYGYRVRAYSGSSAGAYSAIAYATTTAATIDVFPASVTFAAAVGGANPAVKTVNVTNSGTGSFTALAATITYGAGATGWLTAFLSATTDPSVLTLSATTGTLTAGTYTATVSLAATGATNSPKTLTVTFTVTSGALITLSAPSVAFSAAPSGSSPPSQALTVTNGGSGTLSGLAVGTIAYGTGQTTGWLAASLSAATAPSTMTLTATVGTLAAGTYTATVPVTASGGVTTQNVSVTFTVAAGPMIGLSSTTVAFSAAPGGASPTARTVTVTNTGTGTLSGLTVGTVVYGAGASGWLGTPTLSATSAPSTLTLTATLGTIAAGTYTAVVPLTSSVAGNSPRSITVTFTVSSSPLIVLGSSTAGFAAQPGGASPATQPIAVTNGGGSTLSSLAVGTIAYGSGATGWLAGSLNTTTAPATLTLTATTGVLAAGTYIATVPVTSSVAGNSPQNVTVTFTVSTSPAISLASTSLTYTANIGGGNPASQTVAVTNGGSTALSGLAVGTITYGAGATGWLGTPTLSSTTAPSTLTVTATLGSLTAGTYTATVPITSGVASNSPQNVLVTFTVTSGPLIALSPTTLNFSATPGGPNPATQAVAVTNSGSGSLGALTVGTITYGAGATNWLAASLNTATAPATLTVSPTTGALAAGSYTATVPIVSGQAANSPQNVSVTFLVSSSALILLNPAAVNFQAAPGGASPPIQAVVVTNGGGSTLSLLTAGTITYGAGASGWLTASVSQTSAPSTITLAATTGSLAAGTYTANVPITATGAGNTPQTIPVTFVVSSSPLITLSGPTTSFMALTGVSPAAQTVAVTNGGGGTLSSLGLGTITYGAGATGWLGASLNQATAPATLTLTATTTSLVAGTYTATVPVTSGVAGNSPQNETVTLVVSAGPLIGLSATTAAFTATAGQGASPGLITINVTNAAGGSLTGLSLSTVSYGPGGSGWLGVGISPSTAPSSLTMSATTGALAAGTYTATLLVTSTAAPNNPRLVTITFTVSAPLPDLIVTAFSVSATPSPAAAGDPINVSFTVKNQGTGAAGAFQVAFYFSVDGTVTTGDVVSTFTCSEPGLAAGVSDTCSGLIPVPASLTAGTYTVAAIADNVGAVTESNEGNNVSATTTVTVVTTIMANGSFTTGATSWTLIGNAIISTTISSTLFGPGHALLGVDINGTGVDNASGAMFQDVTIPAGAVNPTLTFWYNITTQEALADPAFDFLTVQVRNTSNTPLVTVRTLSNVDHDANNAPGYPNYQQVKFDLTPYVSGATTLRIYFSVTSDGSLTTVFRVDNVNVTRQ
jgi:hypothetical protein